MLSKMKLLYGVSIVVLLTLSITAAAGIQESKFQALLGSWTVEADAGGQIIPLTFKFTAEGETIKGLMLFDMGEGELQDIIFEGKDLSFRVSIDVNGQLMDIQGQAQIDGDTISGTLSSEMGDAPFSGTREKTG